MYTKYSKDQVISKIKEYIKEHNYIPTKRELIKNTDLTNQNFVNSGGYLKLLEGLGYTHPREMTKDEILQRLSDYLSTLDYVPYQREIYENKIVHYTTMDKHGGYENLLKELGYEYPKWRAEDWSKEEMKEVFLETYSDKAPSIEQVYEDYQSGKLPFSTFVIRRKFGTLNTFAKYCELDMNVFSINYYKKEEIKKMFLRLYNVDDIPPTKLEVDGDYECNNFKFSSDMLHNKFRSYNEFLKYCGFEMFNSRFSYPCVAKDGHLCDSRAEKVVDDFMYNNGIIHIPHPRYKDFIVGFKKNNLADWMLEDGTVVEYFGLTGREQYDKKTKHKISVLQENNKKYIAIYPNDINNLDSLFGEYLERTVN